MKYRLEFPLISAWVPRFLNEWLEESMPVDLRVIQGQRNGFRVLTVYIEASTPEDLEAKRNAFNTMIEAKGYGPI